MADSILRPYRYSYSGADAKVFMMLSSNPETVTLLESIHTLSVSVHEAKGQARALGYRGVKGLSRGVRTIAGSMIFTVIEDHPLRPIIKQVEDNMRWYRGGWSVDRDLRGVGKAIDTFSFDNRLVELLPPVDVLVTYVSEGGDFKAGTKTGNQSTFVDLASYKGAAMLIQNIDFVDSGIVTSVNDIVSEITMSFIATDFKPISLNEFQVGGGPGWNVQTSQELRSRHSQLETLLYGDWTPANGDIQTDNPDFDNAVNDGLGDFPISSGSRA